MKSALLVALGMCVGALMTQTGTAQDNAPRGLNHVGIAVKSVDEAVAFYRKTLGVREAYSLKRPDGSPLLTYLQISRDTFLEVLPPTADQPAGSITHFAVETWKEFRKAIEPFRAPLMIVGGTVRLLCPI